MNKTYSKKDALIDWILLFLALILLIPIAFILWIGGHLINLIKKFNEWMKK